MLHLPILRRGEPYYSVDVSRTNNFRTGEPFVEISQANSGLIRRDLLRQSESRTALARHSTAELISMCRIAAEYFANDDLPLGEQSQSPQQYVEQLSTTTGLPHTLVRRNMSKIASAMAQSDQIVRGLTRGLDFAALDIGYTAGETPLSYFPRSNTLGVVLPNNSPGVHSLWLPAIPLKTALVLKPGSAEPWTPFRVIQAMIKAGVPREAFHFYPSDHAGAGEILRSCGRGMIFGDVSTMKQYANDPRIELHGPGWSKIIIGEDEADNWERHLDVIASSVADNSGRSCINASSIWTPRHGRAIAEALAERLRSIEPKAADDPNAALAPFTDPKVAGRISLMIDQGLAEPGATDMMNRDRVATLGGATYLLPTILHVESPDHGMANKEFLFPFASVVECPQESYLSKIGPTLVVTALTENPGLRGALLRSPEVGRLNFGSIPTNHISWDQPHEGNLFDHLYARRAFQAA
ncbi:MAG: aldehyde dehydrogenase family protein [Bryobacteraceae bacterium]|nr:aldehyde dehydrogenase family protein [Bryobacteraceae bacterium]